MTRFGDYLDEVNERGAKFLNRNEHGSKAAPHARMVLGDAVVNTYNGAQLIRGRATGSPGVQVHDALLGDTDEPCMLADGQTWSYTHAMANKLEHPNCTRVFSILPVGTAVDLDRE